MLTTGQIEWMSGVAETMDLNGIWVYFDEPGGSTFAPHGLVTFEDRRDGFLQTVLSLLEANYIQLRNFSDNAPAEGTHAQQVQQLREVFPSDDEDMLDGLWFFMPDCPLGCTWEWKDQPPRAPLILLPYAPLTA